MKPSRKRFCLEYLKDFNGARAAIDAKYSEKAAKQIASELLTKPDVQKFLAKRTRLIFDAAELEVEDIVRHLIRMAFFDMGEIIDPDGKILPVHEWPEHARRTVQSVEIEEKLELGGRNKDDAIVTTKKVKIPSREKNTENLGRFMTMFTDQIKDITDSKEVVKIYVPAFSTIEDGRLLPAPANTGFSDNGDDENDGGNGKLTNRN